MITFKEFLNEDWQDAKHKNPDGGLTKSGVMVIEEKIPEANYKLLLPLNHLN